MSVARVRSAMFLGQAHRATLFAQLRATKRNPLFINQLERFSITIRFIDTTCYMASSAPELDD
jgi:hypothetical protein